MRTGLEALKDRLAHSEEVMHPKDLEEDYVTKRLDGTDQQRMSGSTVLLVLLKWAGAILGIVGATLTAANIGLSGLGFATLFMSSLAWVGAGLLMREPSIVLLNAVFVAINLMGAARWL